MVKGGDTKMVRITNKAYVNRIDIGDTQVIIGLSNGDNIVMTKENYEHIVNSQTLMNRLIEYDSKQEKLVAVYFEEKATVKGKIK